MSDARRAGVGERCATIVAAVSLLAIVTAGPALALTHGARASTVPVPAAPSVLAWSALAWSALAPPSLAPRAGSTPRTAGERPTGCPTVAQSELLHDRLNGFRLALPGHWRNLRPGDEGWVSIYGEHGTPTELDVASGFVADFAVPLLPPDRDPEVNLTVYVRGIAYADSLAMVAAYYGFMLTTLEAPARTIRHEELSLPAGPAIRISADMPAVGYGPRPGSDLDTRLVIYVLVHGGRAWYLAFASGAPNADGYARTFECVAWSLTFDGAPGRGVPEGMT